jgi:endoglucanase
LYLATNQTAFLDEAQSMYSDAKFQGSNAVLNWDSKVSRDLSSRFSTCRKHYTNVVRFVSFQVPALPLLFTQIKAARSVSLPSTYQTEMERYFDRIVNNQKTKDVQSSMTNGGLLYYQGDSNEASLNPALNW